MFGTPYKNKGVPPNFFCPSSGRWSRGVPKNFFGQKSGKPPNSLRPLGNQPFPSRSPATGPKRVAKLPHASGSGFWAQPAKERPFPGLGILRRWIFCWCSSSRSALRTFFSPMPRRSPI